MNKFKLFSISLNIHQNQAEFALLHEVDCVNFKPSYLSQILTDFNEIFMAMPEIPISIINSGIPEYFFKNRDSNLGPLGNLTIHVILFEALLLDSLIFL